MISIKSIIFKMKNEEQACISMLFLLYSFPIFPKGRLPHLNHNGNILHKNILWKTYIYTQFGSLPPCLHHLFHVNTGDLPASELTKEFRNKLLLV